LEGFAGQESRGEVGEETGLALALLGTPPFVQGAREDQPHQHGGDQETKCSRQVFSMLDPQRVARLGEEEREPER
jgi:hypothetical protein